MGLSIHYSGRIANPDFLPGLVEEVEDIIKLHGWYYYIFERNFPEKSTESPIYNGNLYGISFSPPDCEPVSICFLSNGRISDSVHLKLFGKSKNQREKKYLYMLSVKTQYAGVETHCFIIQLFRYLNKKYFSDFNMCDEGSYWETNNKALLKFNFEKYNTLIKAFSSAIENYPLLPEEDIEAYIKRLVEQLSGNRKH